MKVGRFLIATILGGAMTACSAPRSTPPRVPALEYTRALNQPISPTEDPRAAIRFVENVDSAVPTVSQPQSAPLKGQDSSELFQPVGLIEPPPYRGPLRTGESSANPSLWREGEGATSLFHDFRAFQPMDLVTVLVTEITEGRKQADTRVNSQSNITAAISAFLGLEKAIPASNPEVDPTALLDASTATQVEGRGETLRRGQLRGTISCMVQEVLPSGILRIQGEKIISVNDEEQIMVMSGLVRPRDVNSRNEVDSGKIANMRIDYYGKGTIGVIQSPGWLMKIVMNIWPF
jgi:flagellar L-ring protein precursor FlgH